jgi:hypothetical protein
VPGKPSHIQLGKIFGGNHVFSENLKTTVNNTIRNLSRIEMVHIYIYPYMYFGVWIKVKKFSPKGGSLHALN